ncbi:MAG: hypothetical protein KIT69_18980, partial [Propionibacteriaceae bacterium]|nr:hypothetical protein [Propionibacteriaceae bacterium]
KKLTVSDNYDIIFNLIGDYFDNPSNDLFIIIKKIINNNKEKINSIMYKIDYDEYTHYNLLQWIVFKYNIHSKTQAEFDKLLDLLESNNIQIDYMNNDNKNIIYYLLCLLGSNWNEYNFNIFSKLVKHVKFDDQLYNNYTQNHIFTLVTDKDYIIKIYKVLLDNKFILDFNYLLNIDNVSPSHIYIYDEIIRYYNELKKKQQVITKNEISDNTTNYLYTIDVTFNILSYCIKNLTNTSLIILNSYIDNCDINCQIMPGGSYFTSNLIANYYESDINTYKQNLIKLINKCIPKISKTCIDYVAQGTSFVSYTIKHIIDNNKYDDEYNLILLKQLLDIENNINNPLSNPLKTLIDCSKSDNFDKILHIIKFLIDNGARLNLVSNNVKINVLYNLSEDHKKYVVDYYNQCIRNNYKNKINLTPNNILVVLKDGSTMNLDNISEIYY